MGKTRLFLLQADLLVAGMAFGTAAAPTDEWYSDLVANLPFCDVIPNGLDDASQLVARHMRQVDVAVVSHPAMPVAAADAGGRNPEDNAMRLWRRVVHGNQLWRALEFFEKDGFHGRIFR